MSLQEIMTLIKARMVKMHKWDCVCVGCEDLRKAYTRMLEAVAEPLVARDARIASLELQLREAQKNERRYLWLRDKEGNEIMRRLMAVSCLDDWDSIIDAAIDLSEMIEARKSVMEQP